MIPHERSLVENYKNRPFAIVGVNSDSKERYKKDNETEDLRVTWNSFYDGGTTGGPIASAWNVSGWPTLYLIDAKGVIRQKNPRDRKEGLDKMIEELVLEAEKEGTAPAKQ